MTPDEELAALRSVPEGIRACIDYRVWSAQELGWLVLCSGAGLNQEYAPETQGVVERLSARGFLYQEHF